MSKNASLSFLAIAASAMAFAGSANASTVAYEPFSGYSAGTINGQTAQGTGEAATTWTTGTGNGLTATLTTGLSFGSMPVSGGALAISTTTATDGDAVIPLSNNITTIPGSGTNTFYGSYLVNVNSTGAASEGSTSLVNSASAPTSAGGGATDYGTDFAAYSSSTKPGINLKNTGSIINSALTPGTTYLLVSQYTRDSTGAIGQTTWLLNAAGYTAVIATPNFTTATLNSDALGYTSVTGVADSDNAATTWMAAHTYGNINGVVDELRYGTSLSDVVVGTPEPTSLGLLAIGGLYTLRRSRRRAV